MADIKTPGRADTQLVGVPASNVGPNVSTIAGTAPVKVEEMSSADQATVFGNGTARNPLSSSGGGGGDIGGGGTLNYLAKFTPDGSTIGDSQITDDGTSVFVGAGDAPIPGSFGAFATDDVQLTAGAQATIDATGNASLVSEGADATVQAVSGDAILLAGADANVRGEVNVAILANTGNATVDAFQDVQIQANQGDVNISALAGDVTISAVTDTTITAGGDGGVIINATAASVQMLAAENITIAGGQLLSISTPHDISITGNDSVTVSSGAGTMDINSLGACVIDSTAGTTISSGPTHPVGFYGAPVVAQQTGVAVTAAAIHAALVNLGLITA